VQLAKDPRVLGGEAATLGEAATVGAAAGMTVATPMVVPRGPIFTRLHYYRFVSDVTWRGLADSFNEKVREYNRQCKGRFDVLELGGGPGGPL
jgi:hypothetical protein